MRIDSGGEQKKRVHRYSQNGFVTCKKPAFSGLSSSTTFAASLVL